MSAYLDSNELKSNKIHNSVLLVTLAIIHALSAFVWLVATIVDSTEPTESAMGVCSPV